MFDLTGRRALVTGAGQGVGRGVARGFAAAGAEVVVNDLVLERAQAVVDEIHQEGGAAVASPFDVTDYEAVTAAVEEVDGVDILVNNAGNAGAGEIELVKFADTDPAGWERYIRVNFYGVLYCARAVLPGMIAKGWGRVVTVVSDAARAGEPGTTVYGAAKAGAAGLTRGVAAENGRYGITANNIALGTMRTPMTEAAWVDPDALHAKAMMKRYAVRRPGLPEDVAALALYLSSDEASWVTGQTYPLNGGYTYSL